MIVYGDSQRTVSTAELIATLARIRQSGTDNTSLLLTTGELTQGLLDAEFARHGCDDWLPLSAACTSLMLAAAELWLGETAADDRFVAALVVMERLAAGIELLSLRVPEGFAFYALLPKQYALAAQRWATQHPQGDVVVIGLRSIGTTLGGVVAASLGRPCLFATVRPCGHPFARRLQPGPKLQARLVEQHDAEFLIVDEGPGLSGSSINSVADWLEDAGVPVDRIHFFPGHCNTLGPQSSARHRARWDRGPRHVVDFEELLGEPHRLLHLPRGELLDVSAGAWRWLVLGDESQWPAVNPQWERRKYVFQQDGSRWLAKFIGLGHLGAAKFERLQRLSNAGLVSTVHDFREGFVIQKWRGDMRPWNGTGEQRAKLPEFVARYLAFLIREFPAPPNAPGASLQQLLEMAIVNTREGMGPNVADRFETWQARFSDISIRLRPTWTDNRLQPWEWLVSDDGTFLKADAADHCAAHDCIGVQDPAWDLAGAVWDPLESTCRHASLSIL